MTIEEILDNHDYKVVVYNVEGGCYVTYPPQLLSKEKIHSLTASFVFKKEELDYRLEINGEVTKNILKLPAYAHKWFIMYGISNVCNSINFDPDLIRYYYNDYPVNDLDEVVYTQDNREADFIRLLNDAIENDFDKQYDFLADDLDIAEGYLMCKKLFS